MADDERFERDGADLHTEIEVSFPQLALGDRIKVPTLDGEAEVEIAPGTQPGDTLPLSGRGMPRLGARGKEGVAKAIDILEKELSVAMALTGTTRVADIGPQVLVDDETKKPARKRKE